MTACVQRLLALAPLLALTACASLPPAAPNAHHVTPKLAVALPVPVIASAARTHPGTPMETPTEPEPADLWRQLRASFAMADCDSDHAVQVWARRYTHNNRQFESKLRAVLPRLVYVQQVAAEYDVPGEFVLLPWVESHFQPVVDGRDGAAGMWQITPLTANAMGLRMDGHYDGRLDVPASADAVMKLLSTYHDQFHDWRVADYAYHAGASATARFIAKHGTPPTRPTIPAWPARDVTREHLTKLLAIACVVREPARFGVNLPTLPRAQHLVQVPITHSIPMALAADHAGMSIDALKHLNGAFSGNTINAGAAAYLLLPASHARQFRDARLDPANAMAALLDDPPPEQQPVAAALATRQLRRPPVHRVRGGDNLWEIARHYSTSVQQLRRWNHLYGDALRPGQMLQVGAGS